MSAGVLEQTKKFRDVVSQRLGRNRRRRRHSPEGATGVNGTLPCRGELRHHRGVADDCGERSLRELLGLFELFLILGCFAGSHDQTEPIKE